MRRAPAKTYQTRAPKGHKLKLLSAALLALSALPATAADGDTGVNHFIVLFDASGSMKRAHSAEWNYWAKKVGNDQALAERLARLVERTLKRPPEGFPALRPDQDLFSFMLFNLDPNAPSYDPERMLLTNDLLVISKGLPPAETFASYDNEARTGQRGATIGLSAAMSGYSPIVAATSTALPYLGTRINKELWGDPDVDRVFIIRITDGRYAASANASDEYSAILREAKRDEIAGFDAYVERNALVLKVFELPSRHTDCALVTHRNNGTDVLDLPYNCASGSFKDVFDEGMGFFINYMEVRAKAETSIDNYFGPTFPSLELDSGVRDGEIRLVGVNPIRAESRTIDDGLVSIAATGVHWRTELSRSWQGCRIDTGLRFARCHDGEDGSLVDLPLDLDAEIGFPPAIDYRFDYEIRFNQTDAAPAPLYPFDLAVAGAQVPVTLLREPLDALLWPEPPSGGLLDLRDLPLGIPNPALYSAPPAEPGEPRPMGDWDFLALANQWAPKIPTDDGVIRPAQVQRVSRDIYDDWRNTHNAQIAEARSFWPTALAALALLTFAGIAIWPRRRLASDLANRAEKGVSIDFNRRDHEPIAMIGTLSVTNDHPLALFWKAPFHRLAIAINERSLSRISAGVVTGEPLPFDYADDGRRPLAISDPNQHELHDRRVPSGKPYPILLDTNAIKDLRASAEGPEPIELSLPVLVDVTRKRKTQTRQIVVPMLLRPQAGRLHMSTDEVDRRGGDHAEICTEFKSGKRAQHLCTYRLRNLAQFRFSTPVRGRVRVRLRTLNDDAADYLVYLLDEEGNPTNERPYELRFRAEMGIPLVADFTRLDNPASEDQYTAFIEVREETDESGATIDSPVWKQQDTWRLRVLRSTDRTDVSMRVEVGTKEHSPTLNCDKPELPQDYAIGSRAHPKPLRRQPEPRQNRMTLFKVRLANACRDGHGHADWHATLDLVDADGLNVKPEAVRLVDKRGQPLHEGQLRDSPVETERVRVLRAELDLNDEMTDIIERNASLHLSLSTTWSIHEDGRLDPGNRRELETRMGITCHLRHEPPADTLAVDFGTSAVAVAHASGPRDNRLLPLHTRLAVIAKERALLGMRIDDAGEASPFLSSECNVELNPEVRKTLRPSEPGFLQLPLHTEAIARNPDLVFSSLKAMMSAGFDVLPLNARKYPFMNERGVLETRNPPWLTDVILGAYRGLIADYIEPLLIDGQRDFSHIYITHPNTYTANHVADLRHIVERMLAGRLERSINRIYPENIRFFSESDSVAYYYLAQLAQKIRGDARRIPLQERILVYDIGAGTLDMTHLVVEWKETLSADGKTPNPDAKTPSRVQVLRRRGVALAGDRLDECIARDIHAHLAQRLDPARYVNPIVEAQYSGPMEPDTRVLLDDLRTQIHKLKVGLSMEQDRFQIEIAKNSLRTKFVETRADQTVEFYEDVDDIEVDDYGQVTLALTRDQILHGANIQAFLSAVTRRQVEQFFDNQPPPDLDTVLVSGRTSLWPGFRQHLAQTLPNVPQWVDFNQDPNTLKQVVVLGVLERAFRWEDLEFEEPDVVGDFGLYWQEVSPDWTFTPWERSGDEKSFNLVNSPEFKIGLRVSGDTPDEGFTAYFSRLSRDYYHASDKTLRFRLDFDNSGWCGATLYNSVGDEIPLHDEFRVATLNYSERPWPLGEAKLQVKEPDDAVKA